MDKFFKFPSTPHLAWLGEKPVRNDKVFSDEERNLFFNGRIVIEEKVDGTNIGISLDEKGTLRVQSRGHFLDRQSHKQFQALWPWLSQHQSDLIGALSDELILFGEWCYAKHSINYTRLPDWFLAFDVYEIKTGIFWNTKKRNSLMNSLGLSEVPFVRDGEFSFPEVLGFLQESSLTDGPLEGIYLRKEDDEKIIARAKIVKPEFAENIGEHWSGKRLVRNQIAEIHSLKQVK